MNNFMNDEHDSTFICLYRTKSMQTDSHFIYIDIQIYKFLIHCTSLSLNFEVKATSRI